MRPSILRSVGSGDRRALAMRDDTHLALAATGLAAVVLAVVECIDPCGVVDTTLSYSVGVAIDECAAKSIGLLVCQCEEGVGGIGRRGRAEGASGDRAGENRGSRATGSGGMLLV